MKISTKGVYALEAMIELASKGEDKCVSVREIAERRSCSIKYLEQIFKSLKTAGIIKSTRGKEGGYQIAKSTTEITSKDIILAVEGKLDPVLCLSQECPRASKCKTQPIWHGVQDEIFHVLQSKTLHDLAQIYHEEVTK